MKLRTFSVLTLTIALLLMVSACDTEITETEEVPENNDVVEHRLSPVAISAISYDDTYIKVVYGQPWKRGRTIFGELVPYNEVWRTGANEATEITLTQPVQMAGHEVEAGTYALFTIPEEEQWTVILNTDLGQWGAFNYDEESDYLRFSVPSHRTDQVVEGFTISFDDTENSSTIMHLAWDDTRIEVPIEFI